MKLAAVKKQDSYRGYSMVEVMVAVFVLAIVMTALFSGIAQGYSVLNTTRENLRATQILTQKAEAVRLCTWTELTSLPANFIDYYTDGSDGRENIAYYGTISVGPATAIPDSVSYYDKIVAVTITVQWTNNLGANQIPHERQIQTESAYNGMVNYIYGYTK